MFTLDLMSDGLLCTVKLLCSLLHSIIMEAVNS